MDKLDIFTSKPQTLAIFLAFAAHLLFASMVTSQTSGPDSSLPKLLLMSFDGFGWNFLSKFPQSDIPNFQRFIDIGVQVRWIENVFPTLTRPNHMSLVSGLYAESHGIVGNNFFDSALNESMPLPGELKESDSKWVDVGAEPIWVTNSKAGGARKSGCIYWPCADAKIKGMLPERQLRGEWTVSLEKFNRMQRIDLALEWLTDSENAVNFVAVYFDEPDDVSHNHGPDSQEVYDAILEYDKAVGHLLNQVQEKGLSGKLNIIITADHGQIPVAFDINKRINIDLLVDSHLYFTQPYLDQPRPMVNMWPKAGAIDTLVARLKHLNLHVATKDSPDLQALHYSSSSRIAPIVVWTEPGWMIVSTTSENDPGKRGQHGWDPRYSVDMYPFFIAMGPAFKKGVRDGAPFHTVDIYPLMCYILGLTPAPNNGSLENVRHILAAKESSAHPAESNSMTSYSGVAIGVVAAILGIVAVVVILWKIRQGKNVSASYKRTFAKAGTKDELLEDGMVILSDEEL